jgi:uncharacterized membrane protein (UPF0127 family)
MRQPSASPRFTGAPSVAIGGVEVPVAVGARARLLGLTWLELEEAGAGLLIPRCSSVHTFGMRFDLDLVFLDSRRRPLATRRALPPRRFAARRGAAAVLELPASAESGNFAAAGGESSRRSAG